MSARLFRENSIVVPTTSTTRVTSELECGKNDEQTSTQYVSMFWPLLCDIYVCLKSKNKVININFKHLRLCWQYLWTFKTSIQVPGEFF